MSESTPLIDPERVKNYHVSDVKTASGKRKSVDVDDKVARELRGLDEAGLRKKAKEYGLADRMDALSHLNEGLRRMTMGNLIRAAIRNGGETRKPRGTAKKTVATKAKAKPRKAKKG